ncbi:DNA polymerase III subunit gamma/tau, partial [Chloroflexota bacterium]
MSSQVFYRKWRPQKLAEVVGQEAVIRTLLNALSGGKVTHAYLFCGPRGTGKTSTGRILAKSVNCFTNGGKGEPCGECDMCRAITDGRAFDVIEIDAASNRGIDEMRDLREKVTYSPNEARFKVYIIDEVHMLTKEASSALLKTLEEPPPHVIFILATTEAHKLLPTIISRCQRFDFRRLSLADTTGKLAEICLAEGISYDEAALKTIAQNSSGSLRDAENILQQIATSYSGAIEIAGVQKSLGISDNARARKLMAYLADGDGAKGLTLINQVYTDGVDLRQFARDVVRVLRMLMIIKTSSPGLLECTAEELAELEAIANNCDMPLVLSGVKLFSALDLGAEKYATLPLELAFMDCILERREANSSLAESTSPQVMKETKKGETAAPIMVDANHTKKPGAQSGQIPVTLDVTEAQQSKEAPKAVIGPASLPIDIDEPVESLTVEDEPAGELPLLTSRWKAMITNAPENISRTSAAAFLRSAHATNIDENEVTICFDHKFHMENMEKANNRKIAATLVSGVLGRECTVNLVWEPGKTKSNHMVKA